MKTVVPEDALTSRPSESHTHERATFSSRLEGDAVLVCSGELDSETTPTLRRSLGHVLLLRPDRIVVDLSRVSFFDAGAIGEFVCARNACRTAGGDLVVRSPSELGRRVLGLVGLANLIAEEPGDDEGRRVGSTADAVSGTQLIDAWETACARPRYGASSLGFEPSALVAALTTLIEDPSSFDRSIVELTSAAMNREELSSATAVMQLWALRDVLHRWIEARRGAAIGPDGDGARRDDLEAALADMASSVVDELEKATLLDPLTGLLNRRALDRDLRQALAAARRRQQCLSVVMIDVEGLKTINDRLGHAAGDDALRAVATNLASALRSGDNAYRIGGDEFVLLLPELHPEDVDGVMERTTVGARGAFTWGCAWVQCDDDGTPDAERATHLLRLADQRMLDYRARARGSRRRTDSLPLPHGMTTEPPGELAGRFVEAQRSSIVIDEAKGLIADHLDVGIDEAFTILRAFSAARHQPVLTTAEALVDRTIPLEHLPHRPGGPAATVSEAGHGDRHDGSPAPESGATA